MNQLTVLICTHNRASLLACALESLNRAQRPEGWHVQILVVANACSDSSHAMLDDYKATAPRNASLPLSWIAEPTPGKSHALNRATAELDTGWIAVVDDDHRVAEDFFLRFAAAVAEHHEATMLCGRILPDWTGNEPQWVHDTGPYRIYPLPIPRQDFGEVSCDIGQDGPIPGGGNQFLKVEVFARIGGFATDLGPRGHDLGGGEDTEFMQRALRSGERLVYVPGIIQYHYVDESRLKFGYVLRKSYQRSRASAQLAEVSGGGIPLYAWRKLFNYALAGLFSLSWERTRFFLVRIAASLGEMSGMRHKSRPEIETLFSGDQPRWASALALLGAGGFGATLALGSSSQTIVTAIFVPMLCAATGSLLLLLSSIRTFSRAGPALRAEIIQHYRWYTLFALLRLTVWAWAVLTLMAGAGVAVYYAWTVLIQVPMSLGNSLLASLAGIGVIFWTQFCRHLLLLPASICASLNVLPSRLYPLWRLLTPGRLHFVMAVIWGAVGSIFVLASVRLLGETQFSELAGLWSAFAAYAGLFLWASDEREPHPAKAAPRNGLPNILMIGADTLRADRLGGEGYCRNLTPILDKLAARGTLFTQCFVPCARTAPSLLSLFTGTWPHRHGVRDNFVADKDTKIPVLALPEQLKQHGYATAAVSDWCGGDLKKFPLGFDLLDLPDDQWNIKYLIRQGPKDLRLFLSLFTHNRFGKAFLPELYYLAGVPLTRDLGRRGRQVISALADEEKPFFLNLFLSTTHPPFGSEYPYYTMFSEPDYDGESKFVMARLTDPFEIIRRQGEPKEEFDFEQIVNLYDACVRRFDDEVGQILSHLEASGLAENTIVVIYSDHGMEFFEHNTWGQGNSAVGEYSARIPLIVVDPRQQGGHVVRDIVRSIDVAPTLLELLGLPIRPSMDGVSLAPYLSDPLFRLELDAYYETGIWLTRIPGQLPEHLHYPELLDLLEVHDKRSGTLEIKPEFFNAVIDAKDRMIRSRKWKLIYMPLTTGYRLSLYNVEADSSCSRDLIDEYPDIAQALWLKLKSWIDRPLSVQDIRHAN